MTNTEPTQLSLWDQFTGWVVAEEDATVNFLKNFFKATAKSEVATLQPFAEEAVQDLGASLPALAGGLTAYATAVTPALLATAQKAEAAGIQAAGSSLVTAVSGAVANAQAAAQGN